MLVTIGDDLGHKLSSSEQELITSITSGGALIGAVFAGLTADRYGRKISIYCGCAVFVVGAIIQAVSFSVAQMTVGRAVVGLGVGASAMVSFFELQAAFISQLIAYLCDLPGGATVY